MICILFLGNRDTDERLYKEWLDIGFSEDFSSKNVHRHCGQDTVPFSLGPKIREQSVVW